MIWLVPGDCIFMNRYIFHRADPVKNPLDYSEDYLFKRYSLDFLNTKINQKKITKCSKNCVMWNIK